MKLLSICDPTKYGSPPLDVPTFYQQLSLDKRVDFYHIPTPQVFTDRFPGIQTALSAAELPYDKFLALGDQAHTWMSLEEIDLVFCRTLKPFPSGYLDTLATWETMARFVNRPSGKKEQMKSEFLLRIAKDYIPDTIVTADWTEALAFFQTFQTIVAKQANSCGGRGVFKIWYQNNAFHVDNILTGTCSFQQFETVMAQLQAGQTEPLQFCRYLQRTDVGDKRIVVVDGEIYGSYLRRSQSGHWVNNVSSDGTCTLSDITADELEAIQQTVGHYQALGLHTLGYDFLMDDDHTWRISEVNAGNIGGFARLELLTGEPVMDRLIGWLLEYARRPQPQIDPLAMVGVA